MKIADEFVIPAQHGRAFVVKRGQAFRIFPMEDGQVGDCVFYNANDTREWFHVGQTWTYNAYLGTGTAKSYKHFYSKPPRENVMLTVLEDTYANHWGNMGARCSRKLYQVRDKLDNHRSCQDNLAEALAPYGLSGDDVMDVFNVFMNVDLHVDGRFTVKPSTVTKNDYIELRAEMDVLAAVSACPADTSPLNCNGGKTSPLGIRIYEIG
ncbi:MAG: urea carboxylase-associated family protein [Betaproteobacteria bacterium]|nr:urea carboxylase-associated family protein [Betaproteobacteria bacterium]